MLKFASVVTQHSDVTKVPRHNQRFLFAIEEGRECRREIKKGF